MNDIVKQNPFPIGSTIYWLLESPLEREFREHPAEIEKWKEECIGGFPSFSMDIWLSPCRRDGLGSLWAVGGIALKTREGVDLPWKSALEKAALDVFGLRALSDFCWTACLLCLWHGRSVAVRNPANRLLFWPEQISQAFNS
jgi:hypothetical protein